MNDLASRRRASPVLVLAVAGIVALLAVAVWRPWSSEDEADGHPDLSLVVDELRSVVSGAPTSWRVTLVNTGDRRALDFESSLTVDVALVRDGEEAFRWSEAIVPTPRPRTLQVPTGRSDFSLSTDALEVTPGTYDLVATMLSDPAPAPLRLELEVTERPERG